MLGHADVKRSLGIVRGWGKLFPAGGSPYEWALTRHASPADAARLAKYLKQTPRERVELNIAAIRAPASAYTAPESYWFHQAVGEAEASREPLKRVAGFGVPVPVEP